MSTPAAQSATPTAGNGRFAPPPPGTRSSGQIKSDIVQQRQDLARSVDALRVRWSRVTDVRAQIKEHRTELLIGAAAVGFLVGGVIALGRRRG